ncbi:MAG: hypothetical protein NVV74_19615 [Magnetospirillum sp.]|nr:hypothetical protein [Magnetospirillum sp.]
MAVRLLGVAVLLAAVQAAQRFHLQLVESYRTAAVVHLHTEAQPVADIVDGGHRMTVIGQTRNAAEPLPAARQLMN